MRVCLEELGADLLKRQIRLLPHKLKRPRLVHSQGRAAVPAAGLLAHAALVPPALHPFDCRRGADRKLARRLPRRSSRLHRPDHAHAKIARIPARMPASSSSRGSHPNLMRQLLGIPLCRSQFQ